MSPNPHSLAHGPMLQDASGRRIDYLRISITDRCDLRCTYCMAEDMTFLPRKQVLDIEELASIAQRFIGRGIRRIRITGGEPLVRRGVGQLVADLGRHLGQGLEELTLTSNGTRLAEHAGHLAASGVRRVNVSLDTLDPDRYRQVTRVGDLKRVLAGLTAAAEAGLKVRINTVVQAGINDDELDRLLGWCGERGLDLGLIEAMPLGPGAGNRVPVARIASDLGRRWTLLPSTHRSAGPARYFQVAETGTRLGLIEPFRHDFCQTCNRMRLTCDGRLYPCLGHDDHVDLRGPLRAAAPDQSRAALDAALDGALDRALTSKPPAHRMGESIAPLRFMSFTGG